MITRAIALLIIVGNEPELRSSKQWERMINYCDENGSLVRGDKILHPRIKMP